VHFQRDTLWKTILATDSTKGLHCNDGFLFHVFPLFC
jgi:hypothetical protein